jgi:hypothetical protein
MPDDLAAAERDTRFIAVQVNYSPEQLEVVRTRTTADDPAPLVLALDHGWQSFLTPSRPKLADRAPRPRGYRRGGPRTRRTRATSGPRKTRAPGSKEPSGSSGTTYVEPALNARFRARARYGAPELDLLDVVALSLGWKRAA